MFIVQISDINMNTHVIITLIFQRRHRVSYKRSMYFIKVTRRLRFVTKKQAINAW